MTMTKKAFDPNNSQSGCWANINGQLALVDNDGKVVKFLPKTFHMPKDGHFHIPTGGPQQLKTYKPAPKMGRQKAQRK